MPTLQQCLRKGTLYSSYLKYKNYTQRSGRAETLMGIKSEYVEVIKNLLLISRYIGKLTPAACRTFCLSGLILLALQ